MMSHKIVGYARLIFICFFFLWVDELALAQVVKVEVWYEENGQRTSLKTVYHHRKGNPSVLEGPYTAYFQNGKISIQGQYLDNQPVEEWRYYYESGSLKTKSILDNERSGYWIYYYEDSGYSSMEGKIENKERVGTWKFYYESGLLKQVGEYRNNKKYGLWKTFYEDGSLKSEAEYVANDGEYREYYPNGKIKSEGFLVNNVGEGIWKYYDEQGKLQSQGRELGGKKSGAWTFYHPDGSISGEGAYSEGTKQGDWKYYHTNGQLSSEGEIKNGLRNGEWKLYHPNGTVKGEGLFVNGEGQYREFHENGKLKVDGYLKNDRNHGTWKYYNDEGVLEAECVYNNGIGTYTAFYPSGVKKMTGLVQDDKKVGVWELYNQDGTLEGYFKTQYKAGSNDPIFVDIAKLKPADLVDTTSIRDSSNVKPFVDDAHLPDFKFKPVKKHKIKNFNHKPHEYHGVIIEANPLAFVNNQLPIAVEYYFQDRLGYELCYTFMKSPILVSESKIANGKIHSNGFSASFKMKFYKKTRDHGLIYMAPEFRYQDLMYNVTIDDTTQIPIVYNELMLKEHRYETSFLIGNRLMKKTNTPGFTFDIHAGIGLGYRMQQKKYQNIPYYDSFFNSIKQQTWYIPLRFGFMFGYVF